MNKLKKQIIGATCLLVVAAMTVVAYSIPNSGASAISSVEDHIRVTVLNGDPYVNISNVSDGDKFLEEDLELEYGISCISHIEFTLSYEGTAIDTWTDLVADEDFENLTSKTHSLDLAYFGEYILEWQIYDVLGNFLEEDSISFYRHSALVKFIEFDEDNQPIFEISYIDTVDSVDIQIYDRATGAELFDPAINYPSDKDIRYTQIQGGSD